MVSKETSENIVTVIFGAYIFIVSLLLLLALIKYLWL